MLGNAKVMLGSNLTFDFMVALWSSANISSVGRRLIELCKACWVESDCSRFDYKAVRGWQGFTLTIVDVINHLESPCMSLINKFATINSFFIHKQKNKEGHPIWAAKPRFPLKGIEEIVSATVEQQSGFWQSRSYHLRTEGYVASTKEVVNK